MSLVLEVSDLSFSHPTKEVFRHVEFSMGPGEIVCLMGPNGCGKTTLLDSILSIHSFEEGSIRLFDQDLARMQRRELAQKMAYVPQVHQVVFPYTVEQIVLMGRTAHLGQFGEPKAKDRRLCREAMDLVGILDLANKPYSQLSGGEVKLVLLARALSQKAPLLVMDEPTANLDFKNELMFLETVVRLNRMDGISVLMATHSPEHAFYFQGKGLEVQAIMMNEGRVVSQGKPDEVITEENIQKVYGVCARIHKEWNGDGTLVRSIALLGTLENRKEEAGH